MLIIYVDVEFITLSTFKCGHVWMCYLEPYTFIEKNILIDFHLFEQYYLVICSCGIGTEANQIFHSGQFSIFDCMMKRRVTL